MSFLGFKNVVDKVNLEHVRGTKFDASTYESVLGEVKDALSGVGELVGQKILHCCTFLGIVEEKRFLCHCHPGSAIHLKRLKECGLPFERRDQVKQLVEVLMRRGGLSALKSEEVWCYCLKGEEDRQKRKDVVIPGAPLYFVQAVGGTCTVWQARAGQEDQPFLPPTYLQPEGGGYQPKWMGSIREFKGSPMVCFPSCRMWLKFEEKFPLAPYKSQAAQVSFNLDLVQKLLS